MKKTSELEEVNFDLLQAMMEHRPNTPAGKRGKISIEHKVTKAGEKLPVVSRRNWLMMGQRPTSVAFDIDVTIRHLKEDEVGTWMSDSPQEVYQMRKPVLDAYGKTLIGGLGLGIVSHLIGEINDICHHVITVEQNPEVDMLVSPHLNRINQTVVADLFKFVKDLRPRSFDYGYFDIWQGTGESTWAEYVVPLRRMARGKVKRLLCWNEEEMKGQLQDALPIKALVTDDVNQWWLHKIFQAATRRAGIKPTIDPIKSGQANTEYLEAMIKDPDPKVKKILNNFLQPGTDQWERHFGKLWDELSPKDDNDTT